MNRDNMTSSEKILTELKWYKLEKRRHLHKATLMYKCLYKESEGVNVTFVRRMDRHNYNTGNRENFVLPKPKKNNLKRIEHLDIHRHKFGIYFHTMLRTQTLLQRLNDPTLISISWFSPII